MLPSFPLSYRFFDTLQYPTLRKAESSQNLIGDKDARQHLVSIR